MSAAHGDRAAAPRRTRDQERALHAHRCLDAVAKEGLLSTYKIHVQDLGPAVLRSGLAAALAWLERGLPADRPDAKPTAEARLMDHLAEHLTRASFLDQRALRGRDLPAQVRELDVRRYQLVTREILHLAVWLRRAVQARSGHD